MTEEISNQELMAELREIRAENKELRTEQKQNTKALRLVIEALQELAAELDDEVLSEEQLKAIEELDPTIMYS